MKIDRKHYRTIWLKEDQSLVQIIDQRFLPHQLVIESLTKVDDFIKAIREMYVRGAPLIGATAAFGMYIAALNAPKQRNLNEYLLEVAEKLNATRPTAVNLTYATKRVMDSLETAASDSEKVAIILQVAQDIVEESVDDCQKIGVAGLELIKTVNTIKDGAPVNILTHCNAGWLACIDHGTATAPIYAAHDAGIPLHVWVDETRPRNQGARLTAYELLQHGVPHTVIADNTGGHLMQNGLVDMVIVGSDRTTVNGDVANKIGTYLKALAARDNEVPFYVALPGSSFDWSLKSGADIPIEQRSATEVKWIQGREGNQLRTVLLTPENSPAVNYGFDITPARLVTALITERGVISATKKGILKAYPEKSE